jgi:hypothetical protein
MRVYWLQTIYFKDLNTIFMSFLKSSDVELVNIILRVVSSANRIDLNFFGLVWKVKMKISWTIVVSVLFRVVFWDILPCKIIVVRRFRCAYGLGRQSFYTAVYPRRQLWTSYSPPWELEISHLTTVSAQEVYFQLFCSSSHFLMIIRLFFPLKVGVGQTQAWMPAYVSILRIPQMIWVCRATVEWYWQGKTEELGEKPVPVPLCPPQIPHGLTRERTRTSAVRGRRLTTWAMARPIRLFVQGV